jgi:hypothetical protein
MQQPFPALSHDQYRQFCKGQVHRTPAQDTSSQPTMINKIPIRGTRSLQCIVLRCVENCAETVLSRITKLLILCVHAPSSPPLDPPVSGCPAASAHVLSHCLGGSLCVATHVWFWTETGGRGRQNSLNPWHAASLGMATRSSCKPLRAPVSAWEGVLHHPSKITLRSHYDTQPSQNACTIIQLH